MQLILDQVGWLAQNWGADVILWANSNTVANVHVVKLMEECWVCGNLS